MNIFHGLLNSCSPEVRLVANLAGRDKASTTGRNLDLISTEINLNPWVATPAGARQNMKLASIPQGDAWRIPVLESYLSKRYWMEQRIED